MHFKKTSKIWSSRFHETKGLIYFFKRKATKKLCKINLLKILENFTYSNKVSQKTVLRIWSSDFFLFPRNGFIILDSGLMRKIPDTYLLFKKFLKISCNLITFFKLTNLIIFQLLLAVWTGFLPPK